MKKVLILGAGLVARPMVEYLMRNGIRIVIASPMKGRADEMIDGNPLGASVDWSMDDRETLDLMVGSNDLTVSLLPYKYHSDVAKVCLRHRKHLVTTSYVQKDMLELDAEAKSKRLIFLNEAGLDPGIDHMSAMKLIDHIHGKGGVVEKFYSICGALPAPEAADNPMRYKFTWSPKGVILASLNDAHYLVDGQEKITGTAQLFRDIFSMEVPGVGELDVYPNRDSMSYIEIYGIPRVQTMYRGTFRFRGWCETLDGMKRLSMLDNTVRDYSGMSYSDFVAERAGTNPGNIKKKIQKILGVKEDSAVMRSFEFLGLFSDEELNYYETTPFEITSDRMISRMMLGDNERDMVVLQHIVLAAWPGGRKEVIRSIMTDFGSHAGNTAISKTVALPASIAVKLILEGRIDTAGVIRPVFPDIYNPVLDELSQLGIAMKEEYDLPADLMPH